VDTHWFQDINVSSPINICIYNWINGYWGVGNRSSWAQSSGSEECYTSENLFKFWGKNSVWFCMSCWDYLSWVYAATFPGAMSLIWLRNVNTAERRMQIAVLKLKYIRKRVVDDKCGPTENLRISESKSH